MLDAAFDGGAGALMLGSDACCEVGQHVRCGEVGGHGLACYPMDADVSISGAAAMLSVSRTFGGVDDTCWQMPKMR